MAKSTFCDGVVVLRPCSNACRSNVSLYRLFEVKVDKKIHFNKNKSIGDLSLTIPLDLLGLVIGKHRKTIKTIKDETNCDSIIIDSNTGHCEFKGPRNCVLKARQCVLQIIEDYKDDSVIVPLHLIGFIIGKRGSRIKQIQEETNCFISIDSESGVCSFIGSPSEIFEAKSKVLQVIQKNNNSIKCSNNENDSQLYYGTMCCNLV